MHVRIERQKEIGRESSTIEEFEIFQNEIRKLIVHPTKPKEKSENCNNYDCKRYKGKIVFEDKAFGTLMRDGYLLKGLKRWEIVNCNKKAIMIHLTNYL